MNARSRLDSEVRSVDTAATAGRTTNTSPAMIANVGHSTAPTDFVVTPAEIEMNSRPMTS